MPEPERSFQHEILRVIMTTSAVMLILMALAFLGFEIAELRSSTVEHVSTLARLIAGNSVGPLASQRKKDAHDMLAALRADPDITAAALYDSQGNLFVIYPKTASLGSVPPTPGPPGYHFQLSRLVLFKEVKHEGGEVGTLYLEASLKSLGERLVVYVLLTMMVLFGALLLGYVLSRRLQQKISGPILALAAAARIVTERNDYTVRVERERGDEIGHLTDWFNRMLDEVHARETALRQSEERLVLAQKAARAGSFEWSIRDDVSIWSKELLGLYGFKEGEHGGHQRDWLSAILPEDRPAAERELQRCLQTGDYSLDFRIRRHDNREVRWMHARGQVFYDSEHRPQRIAGINVDITERKLAEEEVVSSLREKEVLLQEIHHRVKNNMQVICSLLNIQAQSLSDEDSRALLKGVSDRVHAMALVHEKLYQSQNLDRIDFSGYVRKLAENLIQSHAKVPGSVRLVLDLQPVSLSIAAAIPCGLILNELVVNSLKHAFPARNGGALSISLQKNDQRVILMVTDNGVGLPDAVDWDNAASLGLRLVQMLTKQIRGSFAITAGPEGRGAAFEVSFDPDALAAPRAADSP